MADISNSDNFESPAFKSILEGTPYANEAVEAQIVENFAGLVNMEKARRWPFEGNPFMVPNDRILGKIPTTQAADYAIGREVPQRGRNIGYELTGESAVEEMPEQSGSTHSLESQDILTKGHKVLKKYLENSLGREMDSYLDVGGPGVLGEMMGVADQTFYITASENILGWGNAIEGNFYDSNTWNKIRDRKFDFISCVPRGPWMGIEVKELLPYAIGVVVNSLNLMSQNGVALIQIPVLEKIHPEDNRTYLATFVAVLEALGMEMIVNKSTEDLLPAVLIKNTRPEEAGPITIDMFAKLFL